MSRIHRLVEVWKLDERVARGIGLAVGTVANYCYPTKANEAESAQAESLAAVLLPMALSAHSPTESFVLECGSWICPNVDHMWGESNVPTGKVDKRMGMVERAITAARLIPPHLEQGIRVAITPDGGMVIRGFELEHSGEFSITKQSKRKHPHRASRATQRPVSALRPVVDLIKYRAAHSGGKSSDRDQEIS